MPNITSIPESVRLYADSRKVWLSEIVALSDGNFWCPNCGGDLNGGGLVVTPTGDATYWGYDKDLGSVLTQLADEGVYPIAKGYDP